jgi:hypothetical protein
MNRKTIIIGLLILFTVLLCTILFLSIDNKKETNLNFSKNYVPNSKIALRIAKIIWNPIYRWKNTLFCKYNIELVDHEIWVIEGIKNLPIAGGGPYIRIKKSTGEILEVSYTK